MFDYHKAQDQFGKDAALEMQNMDQTRRSTTTRMSNEAKELRSQVKELATEVEYLKAALRKCLPSHPHMNCSAERWAADEYISVAMHRREWEQIAELALTPDELKEYILYPREA